MELAYLILASIVPLVGGIFGLYFGAKLGQKVGKGEEIKMPTMQERKEQREAHREAAMDAEKLNAILENIKNYNGTGSGQREVPRG